jgi:hypothetical protein
MRHKHREREREGERDNSGFRLQKKRCTRHMEMNNARSHQKSDEG